MSSMAATINWERIEDAYEVWAEVGDIDQVPTRAQASEVSRRLRALGWSHADPGKVIAWLTDRRTYSPYVDEVAIERIIRSQSWDSAATILTAREYHILLERLVDIVDRQMAFEKPRAPFDDVPWKAQGHDGASMWDLEGGRFARENKGRRFGATLVPSWGARVTFPDHHSVRQAVDQRRSRRGRVQAAAA